MEPYAIWLEDMQTGTRRLPAADDHDVRAVHDRNLPGGFPHIAADFQRRIDFVDLGLRILSPQKCQSGHAGGSCLQK